MVVFIFNVNSSIKLALTGVWEGRKVKKGTLSLGDRLHYFPYPDQNNPKNKAKLVSPASHPFICSGIHKPSGRPSTAKENALYAVSDNEVKAHLWD